MMTDTKPNIDATLDQIQDRLDELASAILETPQWRRNSPWHLDRASERQRLLAQRDQLRKRWS